MATTIADISGGRFGVNIVSGWHKIEYSQMGLWPGDDHFGKRYDYSTEYVRVMQELWDAGHSDFRGEYFQMEACKLSPRPARPIKLVAAGTAISTSRSARASTNRPEPPASPPACWRTPKRRAAMSAATCSI